MSSAKTHLRTQTDRRLAVVITAISQDPATLAQWLYFLDACSQVFTRPIEIVLQTPLPPSLETLDCVTGIANLTCLTENNPRNIAMDWEAEDLATIGDSATLSAAMFKAFDRLHIYAQKPPENINISVFDAVKIFMLQNEKNTDQPFSRMLAALGLSPLPSMREWQPRCTLLTSAFNDDAFIEAFLANCGELNHYNHNEHLIARPCSPGSEHDPLTEHVILHANAAYLWYHKDPGLYETWNALIRLSTSPYLSNANLDDQRAPEQLDRLTEILDQSATVQLASAGLRVSTRKHLRWADSGDCETKFTTNVPQKYSAQDLIKYDQGRATSHNIPHCMPVWRKSVHLSNGYFNEQTFGPSADWAFWLNVGRQADAFQHLNMPLGLYLKTEDSYWERTKDNAAFDQAIARRYTDGFERYHWPEDRRPLALRMAEIMALRQQKLFARYLWCLIQLKQAAGKTNTKLDLLMEKLVVESLGIPKAIWRQPLYLAEIGESDYLTSAQSLLDLLTTALHHPDSVAHMSDATVITNLSQLADEFITSGSPLHAYLYKGLLYRCLQKPLYEQYFLRRAHALGEELFWPVWAHVYQSCAPKAEIEDYVA
jgi:hypothetical protein